MSTAHDFIADPEFTLGQRIRKARVDARLDQADLAIKVGVSRPQVSKWERDKAVPDVYEAITIAEVTRQPFGWLCGVDARSRCSSPSPVLTVVDGEKYDTPRRTGHLRIVR